MTPSASHMLLERFGIAAHPGGKVECPFCHHETFTLKRDDLLGKCFHPSCGRFLTPNGTDLCKELADLSEASGIKFAYQGKPRAFAQRMSHLHRTWKTFS